MCFGDWSRLDLFTNDELEGILEEEDNARKAGKGIGGLSLVDDDIVAIL